MIRQERDQKKQMQARLNAEYNADIAKLEADRQAEIDAKKAVRPRVYGE